MHLSEAASWHLAPLLPSLMLRGSIISERHTDCVMFSRELYNVENCCYESKAAGRVDEKAATWFDNDLEPFPTFYDLLLTGGKLVVVVGVVAEAEELALPVVDVFGAEEKFVSMGTPASMIVPVDWLFCPAPNTRRESAQRRINSCQHIIQADVWDHRKNHKCLQDRILKVESKSRM